MFWVEKIDGTKERWTTMGSVEATVEALAALPKSRSEALTSNGLPAVVRHAPPREDPIWREG
jgi:hypothetical protein